MSGHSTNQACRPRMSKHQSRMHSAPTGRARGVQSISVELVRPVGRHRNLNQKSVCESAPEGGGRADTLFAGKAERTAMIALERQTRSLACRRRTKNLACWPLQETKPGPPTASDDRDSVTEASAAALQAGRRLEIKLAGRHKTLLCSC